MKTDKRLKKRFSLTLIEVLVAFTLVGVIVGECFFILTKQIKAASYSKKLISGYIGKKTALLEVKNLFLKAYIIEKECIKTGSGCVELIADLGNRLLPSSSYIQKGTLKIKDKELLFETKHQKIILMKDVEEFFCEFYSQNSKWQKEWDSSQSGLPEMMHLKIKGSFGLIDKKFILPYNVKVIGKTCSSSPSFSP